MIPIRTLAGIPYGWTVVGLCLVAIIPFSFFHLGLGVLFPFIQEDLGINRAEVGLIASGRFFGMGATVLLMGWLADAIGVRRLLAAAMAVAATAVVLFSQIQSPLHGILVGLLVGGALSAVAPAFSKALMDWVTPKTRGLAMGVAEASIPISGIIAAVLISFLAVTYGWRTVVILLGIMIAGSSVVFYSFYRDKAGVNTEKEQGVGSGRRVSLVARNPYIWLAGSFSFALAAIQSVLGSYLVLFLKEYLGLSTVVAGAVLATALAGGAVGRIGWGLISDSLLRGRRVATLAIIGMLSVVSMALMAWLPSDAPLAVVLILILFVGSTSMGWSGVHAVYVAELAGTALTGTAIGFVITISVVGVFAIVPVFGLIVDQTGSYDLGWWTMAGVASVSTLLLLFLRPQPRS